MENKAAGLFCAWLLGSGVGLAQCKGPAALEARAKVSRDGVAASELGTWFGQHSQFACANDAFRESLRLNPKSAKVNYFLGVSLYSAGQGEAALMPLQRSTELDAKAVQPRMLLATILTELGRRAEVEAQLRAVLKIDPAEDDARDGLAKALLADHEYEAAIELLRAAPARKVPDEVLTLDLASAYGQAGRLDEAAATIKAAMGAGASKTKPASIALTKALATVYVHQHRYQDARGLLEEYLKGHAADGEARVEYMSILVLTSDLEAARPFGAKLLAEFPDRFEVLSLNGIVERESGEYAAARGHLEAAVKLNPSDYTARYNLGATLVHLDDAAGAKRELEEAIRLDGTQADAHFQLAGVERTLGDAAGAQTELATFERLKREATGRAEAESAGQQAELKLAAGNVTEAVALYKKAVDANPADALMQYKLALALERAADRVGEKSALEAAIRIDATFALAQNQLGYVLSQSGDSAGAEKHFKAAVGAAPEFTGAWINLAATLAAEGKFDEAQDAVGTALKLEPKNEQALALRLQLRAAGHS